MASPPSWPLLDQAKPHTVSHLIMNANSVAVHTARVASGQVARPADRYRLRLTRTFAKNR
jgi:hypothetical protein